MSWRKTLIRQTSVVAVRRTIPTLISHIPSHLYCILGFLRWRLSFHCQLLSWRKTMTRQTSVVGVRRTVPTPISHIHHISAVSSVSFVGDSVPIVKCCHGGRRWLDKLWLLLYVGQYQLWLATFITSLLYPRFPSLETQFPLSNVVMEEDDNSTNLGCCCTSDSTNSD